MKVVAQQSADRFVRACIQQKLHSEGGFPQQHLSACRATATPAVRSCFQDANEGYDRRLPRIGKLIVEACVHSRIVSEGLLHRASSGVQEVRLRAS